MKHPNKLFTALAFALATGLTVPAFADGAEKPQPEPEVKTEEAPAPAPVVEPAPVPEEDTTNVDVTVNVEDEEAMPAAAAPAKPSRRERMKEYWNFKRFGVGAGISIGDGDEAFKLDVNVGPLSGFYYADRSGGVAFESPAIPVWKDRLTITPIGVGLAIAPDNAQQLSVTNVDRKLDVYVPSHVDLRLVAGLHFRGGVAWFIPTKAGDHDHIDGDVRRESLKSPRGELSLRYAF
jgi:hypothetical protein